MTKKDETISQIRKVRHTISEEYEHNPRKLVNYYIELQKQYPQLVQFEDNLTEPFQVKK